MTENFNDWDKDILTFEKIGKYLIRNGKIGYWLFGGVLIVAWDSTGFISFLKYGLWIFEPKYKVISTTVLFFFVLIGLRYLKRVFFTTLKEYEISSNSYTLFNKKIWWLLFFLLIINQLWWFLNEYIYLLDHPEVIGTSYQRGANLGMPILLYNTIISTILFIIFVDLIAVGINIFVLPFKIKNELKIHIISEDGCGGTKKIGNLLLSYTKVYFILLVIATLGRYPGINSPLFWYYMIFVIIAWIFGMFLFFSPMRPIRDQIKFFKSKNLKKISRELGEPLEVGKVFRANYPLNILVLLKLKDDIINIREYPFNYEILKEFVFYCFMPILSNIIVALIVK